ncbi:MAG: ABC transporter ATP-binding protein [Acetobacteraceae bacterium]|nr:ABC transporter ATP-binding protein [Pseudomonadota bacterium]
MPEVVVHAKAVEKKYRDVAAVRGVDLEVFRGEFLTLLGPSGCGKTTLLRMIVGFEQPTTGRIVIDGRDVTEVPTYRRPIGMVLQNLALFPHMNVQENITFGLLTRGERKSAALQKATQMLSLVGLAGFGHRLIHELSGGQKQRVALARSIVLEPSVLLLDEPLGALDLKLRQQMQGELKRIQRQVGITFIFVTHDQEEALTMSDRIVVMNAGRIEQIGAPQEIYDHPETMFVASFVGDTNVFAGRAIATAGARVSVELPALGQTVEVQGRGITPGMAVNVMIRPEFVALDDQPGAPCSGQVTDRTFVGADIRYSVTVGNQNLEARRPHRPEDRMLAPSATSGVTIDWANGIAFPSAA